MRRSSVPLAAAFLAALLLRARPLRAQAAAPTSVPNGQVMGDKDNRILWIFPNYRTVEEANSLPTITAREKLTLAASDSFDPYAFPVAGMFAGLDYAEDQDSSWGRGVQGYEKRYVAALADQTMSNLMSEAVFPIMLDEDPRYFRLGRGGFLHRTGYAVSRIFVTRTDSGGQEFNFSEFGGNAVTAAGGILYYPRDDRTFGSTTERYGTQIGFDLITNVAKEFWPDVKSWLLGK
jgi:hypothetical protein